MKTAVYPGSFDPITLGHLDVIKRAASLFDRVVVTVMINRSKTPMFTVEERIQLIRDAVSDLPNVVVDSYEGLLVNYLKVHEHNILVKGLRAISDFEAEFQMASVNQKLCPNVETVFIMTRSAYMYLSSSVVKEVAHYKGDISHFVTESVCRAIQAKMEDAYDGEATGV